MGAKIEQFEPPVPLAELIMVAGLGTMGSGREWCEREHIPIAHSWQGEEIISPADARRLLSKLRGIRAEVERLDAEYNAYLGTWERERAAAGESAFQEQKKLEGDRQRKYFSNPRAHGHPTQMPPSFVGMELPFLDGSTAQACQKAAAEARQEYERKHPRMTREAYDKKHGRKTT